MDFVAFDVETADQQEHSICQWGAVLVKNGEIVDKFSSLVNPETKFNEIAARQSHKITAADVVDAPTFSQLWQRLPEWSFQYPIIAHNASTEYSALLRSCQRYGIAMPSIDFRCTMASFHNEFPNQNYGLKAVANYFGIAFENHHSALSDAECAAQIALRLLQEGISLQSYVPGETKEKSRSIGGHPASKGSRLVKPECDFWRGKIQFEEKCFVVTGEGDEYSQDEIRGMIKCKGGITHNSAGKELGVSRKTSYLIVGYERDKVVKVAGWKSGKIVKAEKMIAEGAPIRIVWFEDLLMQCEKGDE